MRRLLVLVVVAVAAALLLTRAEPFRPTVTLETPIDFVGRATPVKITAHDRGTGLAEVEIRLVPNAGEAVVLSHQSFPPGSGWLGFGGVHEADVAATLDAATAHVPEGPATLEIRAQDHSWLAGLRGGARLTRPVTVDVTPPTLELVSTQHVVRLGGSECAVYRIGADAVESGVQVGDEFFPGTPGVFTDGALRAALFAVPQDQPEARPAVRARDAAGNARTIAMGADIRGRRFADKSLPVTDEFLSRKVPELLQANGLDQSGDLVAGYLRINRELRATTERRVREICRDSAPRPLWQGEFLRLPNSAPLSGFADRRTYLYGGKPIDQQTHLGFDLASLRGSPVPAGNTGRVVFAGPLGIYGNTVILDHGCGLMTLYAHLSSIDVKQGDSVKRGQVIGRSGATGLAGGDHLHFSVLLQGIPVNPVEWWDPHWIHDRIESKIGARG